MTLPPIFTPEYYAHWREFEDASWWNAAMRDIATELLALVPLPRVGTVLDVGCGSGQGMRWFAAAHPEWTQIGIDPGRQGLAAARQAGFDAIIEGSATAMPLRDAQADLAITLDVLQHLPLDGGDIATLREIRRVLRPGGMLLIRTNAQTFPEVPDDSDAQWRRYHPRDLRTKLLDSGFEVLRLSRINALLGLAEIPRDLRRRSRDAAHSSYEVVHTTPVASRGASWHIKRWWLRTEGRLVSAGVALPFGRSIVALCRAT